LKLFGIRIPFTKQGDTNLVTPMTPLLRVPSSWGWITEAFGGMWQRNLVLDSTQNLLSFSAVYACNSLISGDIAKLGMLLEQRQGNGIWGEFESPAFSPVLRKPNRYQTRMQFVEQWLLAKLIWGNTYVLKERDDRGVVVAMYVIDSQRVTPLVAPDGEVFYQLQEDWLAGVPAGKVSVPASEIIHDRGKCFFHPLIGVPPLWAAAMSTTQASRIQTNSSKFFENMSRPSGHLTAPGMIDEATMARMKDQFDKGFAGANIGKLLVTGSGLKYEPFTMPADQAQLIEQLGWTVEDVARAYGVPLYKIAAQKDVKIDAAMNQEYYNRVLHPYIEAMEELLKEGLALRNDVRVRIDVDELLRMDPKTRFEKNQIGVRGGFLAPNEARADENLRPVNGGETPFLQHQDYPLSAFVDRKLPDESKVAPPPPASAPANEEDEDAEMTASLESAVAKFNRGPTWLNPI